MTEEDYYNRRTEADWIEEHTRSMKGCRNLIFLTIGIWALIALIVFLFKK